MPLASPPTPHAPSPHPPVPGEAGSPFTPVPKLLCPNTLTEVDPVPVVTRSPGRFVASPWRTVVLSAWFDTPSFMLSPVAMLILLSMSLNLRNVQRHLHRRSVGPVSSCLLGAWPR